MSRAISFTISNRKLLGFRYFLLLMCCLCAAPLLAQDTTAVSRDAVQALEEVVIHAYERDQAKMFSPMPVAVITTKELDNYAPQSAVQAVNAIPGVRMEERSPSSYRFNIRGSSMRSPFGVRNVKVYFNDLPYTEPGGTSYINQLGLLHFAGAEIVKGPGGSMYGAGTGGVMLLQHAAAEASSLQAGYSFGSYGSHTFFADLNWRKNEVSQNLSYQQSISTGYREQSAANRRILSWNGLCRINEKQQVQTSFLIGNLHYETPGALTLPEYEKDPAAARPAAGSFPSASAARAAIDQQMAWSGISLQSEIARGLSNKTGVYAAYTRLDNAAIRNYSYSTEPHGGLRTVFSFERQLSSLLLHLNAGAEWQTGTTSLEVHANNLGSPGLLQKSENIKATQGFVFVQGSMGWKGWELLLGASLNNTAIAYRQLQPAALGPLKRSFSNRIMPRLSLSRIVTNDLFAYVSYSKGFSPPVTDELLPSGSAFNGSLQPEEGQNVEAGLRYRITNRLSLEANAYYFKLNHTIVQRRDAGGGDYYLNAGSTRQPGLEVSATYHGGRKEGLLYHINASYAYQPYRYVNFVREQEDYSGNALPGLARHNLYAALHLELVSRYLVQVNYYYNSAIALNDANTDIAKENHLLSAKAGIRFVAGKYNFKFFAGADNLLNQHYSAGYDINAAGGRYYNAAALRNYYLQFVFSR